MKAHPPLTQISGRTRSGDIGEANTASFFSQNRFAPLSIAFGLHLLLLGLLMTQAPLRQSIVRLMPVTMLAMPLSKITLSPVSVAPAFSSAPDKQSALSPSANRQSAPIPQTQSPLARLAVNQSVPPAVTIERDFPANLLPVLNVPNPVTERREEMPQPATSLVAESERNESLKIGEMDNNVIVITKLGASKAEYLAPNFLHAQLEQSHFRVEVGDFEDIETALVNQIITQIRTRYKKEIFWNSKIKARMIRLSMLPQDHAELEKFLKMEIFGKKKVRDYSFWDKSKF